MKNQELLEKAKQISNNAYAPYSKFKVGAAVIFEDGSVYTGCNVENASYGLSLCAERNALSTAIAEGKKNKLKKVAIYSPNAKLCYPCGACRQWISEFSKDVEIIVEEQDSGILITTISKLLPNSFNL